MSNSMRPHRQKPTRLPRPWDSPGKNTGVGCHFLLQRMKVKSESEVAQSCLTLSNPMDCSLPGSSVHGIFQARVLEWGAIAFSGIIVYIQLIHFLVQQRLTQHCKATICTSPSPLPWQKKMKASALDYEGQISVPLLTRLSLVKLLDFSGIRKLDLISKESCEN